MSKSLRCKIKHEYEFNHEGIFLIRILMFDFTIDRYRRLSLVKQSDYVSSVHDTVVLTLVREEKVVCPRT